MKKSVIILGSTGSIGRQTLDVCELLGIRVAVLAAKSSDELMFEQALRVRPELLVLEDADAAERLRYRCKVEGLRCEVRSGREALLAAAAWPSADTLVAAMVGIAGLEPVLAAIEAGKDIALANKETLVVAGNLVMARAKAKGIALLPVDSEHSAIWQCLASGKPEELESIYLTCSGGPFRGKRKDELANVTLTEALSHPTWNMGGKISIDSATLMNKGLELIEACHLFNVSEEQVEVVVHPESIIHSMVGWRDHSVIAQLGFPDMRLPIQLALTYPDRLPSLERRFDPFAPGASVLHFEKPDEETFRAITLARLAQREGHCLPIVLNAANEVAVNSFLAGEIPFLAITAIVESAMESMAAVDQAAAADLAGILEIDREARQVAGELCTLWAK